MKIRISALDYHLPDLVEDNKLLAIENPDWDMDKILPKTGIYKRHICASKETALDLATKAGEKLLQGRDDLNEIDLLILVTQSADYVLPSSSCIVQNRLKLKSDSMAFDVNLGCSGFVYALSIAGGLIESGVAKKGLILCADTYTKYIDKDDRTCRPIFSDGASATLIESSNNNQNIGPFDFGTDGSGYDKLIVKNSGARVDNTEEGAPSKSLKMLGSDVFLFTMNIVPQAVMSLLRKSSLTIEDIDMIIFHQASKIVIDNLINKLSLNKDKVFTNYQNIGNTVSSTIPIALKDASDQGRIKNGDKVMLVGFGVGLSWGATIINWYI